MSSLFDSSALIAALDSRHPHHAWALERLVEAGRSDEMPVVAGHSIAETYAGLTGMPAGRRASPAAAERALLECLGKGWRIAALAPEDYLDVVRRCARTSIAGGTVYDAVIAAAGRRAHVRRVVTLNTKDFRRVAPDPEIDAP